MCIIYRGGGWVGGREGGSKKQFKNRRCGFHRLGIIYPQVKSFPTDTSCTHQSAFGTADMTAYLPTHVPNLDRCWGDKGGHQWLFVHGVYVCTYLCMHVCMYVVHLCVWVLVNWTQDLWWVYLLYSYVLVWMAITNPRNSQLRAQHLKCLSRTCKRMVSVLILYCTTCSYRGRVSNFATVRVSLKH